MSSWNSCGVCIYWCQPLGTSNLLPSTQQLLTHVLKNECTWSHAEGRDGTCSFRELGWWKLHVQHPVPQLSVHLVSLPAVPGPCNYLAHNFRQLVWCGVFGLWSLSVSLTGFGFFLVRNPPIFQLYNSVKGGLSHPTAVTPQNVTISPLPFHQVTPVPSQCFCILSTCQSNSLSGEVEVQ